MEKHARCGRTSEVTTQHEIQYEEAIFVVLECVTQVDDERVVDLNSGKRIRIRHSPQLAIVLHKQRVSNTYLLQKPPFLYDISYRFHLYTLSLVDVFESIKISSLLVLNDPNLCTTIISCLSD